MRALALYAALLGGCYESADPLGDFGTAGAHALEGSLGTCPAELGLQCGGRLGAGYCQMPAGVLHTIARCSVGECPPGSVCVGTAERGICALTCGEVEGPPLL